MTTEKKFQLLYYWNFFPVWNICQNGYFKKSVEINRRFAIFKNSKSWNHHFLLKKTTYAIWLFHICKCYNFCQNSKRGSSRDHLSLFHALQLFSVTLGNDFLLALKYFKEINIAWSFTKKHESYTANFSPIKIVGKPRVAKGTL